VGIFLLLANMGVLPEHSLWTLLRLWPLILIVIGLDIIFGRRSPFIGALIGIGVVAVAVVFVLSAPSLGIVPTGETLITERFTEPIGNTTEAEINLKLSIGKTTINALSDSNDLIDAEITHFGDVNFDVKGGKEKTVSLNQRSVRFDFGDLRWFDTEDLQWDIGLSPEIPLVLTIDGSVGQSVLDLLGLQIEKIKINGDVGVFELTLPALEEAYDVEIDGGVGAFKVDIEQGAAVTLTIDGDVGDFVIDVPDNADVRVDAEIDIGNLSVSSRFNQVSERDDDFLGSSGVWETPGFDDAEIKIFIVFNGSIGGLNVR